LMRGRNGILRSFLAFATRRYPVGSLSLDPVTGASGRRARARLAAPASQPETSGLSCARARAWRCAAARRTRTGRRAAVGSGPDAPPGSGGRRGQPWLGRSRPPGCPSPSRARGRGQRVSGSSTRRRTAAGRSTRSTGPWPPARPWRSTRSSTTTHTACSTSARAGPGRRCTCCGTSGAWRSTLPSDVRLVSRQSCSPLTRR
jgi:hypothetical protein